MAHSEDLGKKVLNHISQYGSIKSAVELFEVSRSSIQRWQNKQKDSGNVAKKARKCKPYKVQDMELVDYINTNQEAYLYEIAEHFNVTIGCIAMALQRLNITRKKRPQNI